MKLLLVGVMHDLLWLESPHDLLLTVFELLSSFVKVIRVLRGRNLRSQLTYKNTYQDLLDYRYPLFCPKLSVAEAANVHNIRFDKKSWSLIKTPQN